METSSGEKADLLTEKRTAPRYRVDVPLTVSVPGQPDPNAGVLVDLSERGCFVGTSLPIRTGWFVSLTFVVARIFCGGAGAVVRTEAGHGFGIEFANVNDHLWSLMQALRGDEFRSSLVRAIADVSVALQ